MACTQVRRAPSRGQTPQGFSSGCELALDTAVVGTREKDGLAVWAADAPRQAALGIVTPDPVLTSNCAVGKYDRLMGYYGLVVGVTTFTRGKGSGWGRLFSSWNKRGTH